MLAISHTYTPEGYKPVFTGKEADKRFNEWQLYINGIKLSNTPKAGGVCFEDEQESLLDQAKELLTLTKR